MQISGGGAVSARALGVISRICEKAGGLEESRAERSGQRHIIRGGPAGRASGLGAAFLSSQAISQFP